MNGRPLAMATDSCWPERVNSSTKLYGMVRRKDAVFQASALESGFELALHIRRQSSRARRQVRDERRVVGIKLAAWVRPKLGLA